MSPVEPLLSLPVGVVVERHKAGSPWAEAEWQAVAVLAGLPEAAAWTPLTGEADATRFYAGAAEIACFRSETDNYRRNLASGAPLLWVALQATGGEPPYEIAAVTADPAEGEALTEAGDALVDTVVMPEPLRRAIAAFVAEHHVERPFERRMRDRADPEVLARRPRHPGKLDER
jgi:hypothetical protein